MCEDGRSEAQEGFVEDEGWIEGSVGEVDLREGVVEASELPKAWRKKAQVGSGRRLSLEFILNMNYDGRWLGWAWGMGRCTTV